MSSGTAKHSAKIILFNSLSKLLRIYHALLPTFYRPKDWSWESFGNFPWVTQSQSDREDFKLLLHNINAHIVQNFVSGSP